MLHENIMHLAREIPKKREVIVNIAIDYTETSTSCTKNSEHEEEIHTVLIT